MRPGLACIIAPCVIAPCVWALLAGPSVASATARQWGIDGTTFVRGGAALREHVLVVVSGWCTFVGDPSIWKEADEFHGEPEAPPTVGQNNYGCEYALVTDDTPLAGAPWDAPRARDDIVYALPHAQFPVEDDSIPALDDIPLAEFYPRMESGAHGVLRAAPGPSRGIAVPGDSPLVGFTDTLRAEIHDGSLTLVAEQRTWKFEDGRELTGPPGAAPPLAPAVPVAEHGQRPSAPVPGDIRDAPVPGDLRRPSEPAAEQVRKPPAPVLADIEEPTVPVLEDIDRSSEPGPAGTPPATTRPSLALDVGLGAGCLLLGLTVGLGLRRRP